MVNVIEEDNSECTCPLFFLGGCNIKINGTSYIEPLIKDLIPSFEQMSPDTRMKWFFLDLGKEYNKKTSVSGLLFKFIYQQGWAAKQGHW